jgi:hypothetical protein
MKGEILDNIRDVVSATAGCASLMMFKMRPNVLLWRGG